MQHRTQKVREHHLIKLSREEGVVKTITAFCETHGIESGAFQAIGAVKDVEMGYYDLDKKKYVFSQYPDIMEVVSMTGNVALVDGKPFLHVHTVLSDTENNAHGGHLVEAIVAVTLEVHLTVFNEAIERSHDNDIGLKLLEP